MRGKTTSLFNRWGGCERKLEEMGEGRGMASLILLVV
jgi:hypothetical protein